MHGPSWAPDEVDITRPSDARVYDYFLGGAHNFASDRAVAHAALAACPHLPRILRENRNFLFRVVRHLVAAGVDQFLDLGSGILTAGNVHELAQAGNPDARVVHVDHDPVAIAVSRTLTAGRPRTYMLAGDLLDVDRVLGEAVDRGGLDLDRPVGLLAVAVLQFVPDEQHPARLMAHYLRALVPGSHLAISHPPRHEDGPDQQSCFTLFAREPSLLPLCPRTGDEVTALFGDLTLVAPGVVPVPDWWPGPTEVGPAKVGPANAVRDHEPMLGGLGRRD